MTGGRRRLVALGTGLVLAAVMAVVLFVGVGTGTRGQSTAATDSAPGIDPAAAQLMQLDVIPAARARPAPAMRLVDQHGRPATLAQFRGKTVVWSLADDRCTDLCPLLAETVVAADRDLGAATRDVVFVSVNANPFYPTPTDVLDWSTANAVEALPNWYYLTGTPRQLQQTWSAYKVTVLPDARTRTVAHDATVEFIDPRGRTRAVGDFAQGAISTAYYAHAMAQMAVDLLPSSERVAVAGPDVAAPSGRGASIGSRAPGFSLRTLGRPGTSQLGAYLHKPVVVNFWASTCSACAAEMPALEEVSRDFGTQLSVVGVDVADPRSRAARYAARLGVTYPLLADPDGSTAGDYHVTALPVTFVIDPGGTVVARHDGALTASELEAVLQMDFQQLTAP